MANLGAGIGGLFEGAGAGAMPYYGQRASTQDDLTKLLTQLYIQNLYQQADPLRQAQTRYQEMLPQLESRRVGVEENQLPINRMNAETARITASEPGVIREQVAKLAPQTFADYQESNLRKIEDLNRKASRAEDYRVGMLQQRQELEPKGLPWYASAMAGPAMPLVLAAQAMGVDKPLSDLFHPGIAGERRVLESAIATQGKDVEKFAQQAQELQSLPAYRNVVEQGPQALGRQVQLKSLLQGATLAGQAPTLPQGGVREDLAKISPGTRKFIEDIGTALKAGRDVPPELMKQYIEYLKELGIGPETAY